MVHSIKSFAQRGFLFLFGKEADQDHDEEAGGDAEDVDARLLPMCWIQPSAMPKGLTEKDEMI